MPFWSRGWSRGKSIAGVGLGACAGLWLGFLLWGGDADLIPARTTTGEALAPARSSAEAAEVEAELRERLARETARRVSLERQLAEQVAPALVLPVAAESAEEEPDDEFRGPWLDAARLARAGFAASEIDVLRERFEAVELEKLYLRDEATREGWLGKPRFRRQMRVLERKYTGLRGEYGEDAYDWILYASGKLNRVMVQHVIEGSEAEAVGLQEGDVFLRYDGQRIFDARSLQQATADGELGQTAPVDLERDGERIRLYPARGPLGVGLESASVEPAEALH
jgi:hypothetical protein